MKHVAEVICVVAVLAFLAFVMPTCRGCGEIGPSPASAVTAQRAELTSTPEAVSLDALWAEALGRRRALLNAYPQGTACEDAVGMADDTREWFKAYEWGGR